MSETTKDLADKMEGAGYIEEANELDAISSAFGDKGESNMNAISSMIDKVANSLESKGYEKEALSLDAISNLIDKMASTIPGQEAALKAGITPKVWANMYDPEKIKFNEWMATMVDNPKILQRVLDPVETAKAVATYDYVRAMKDPSLSALVTSIDGKRKRALQDLQLIERGLKVIPELVKWIRKTHNENLDKYLQDDKFVQKARSELKR